jgi:hypothetical protein
MIAHVTDPPLLPQTQDFVDYASRLFASYPVRCISSGIDVILVTTVCKLSRMFMSIPSWFCAAIIFPPADPPLVSIIVRNGNCRLICAWCGSLRTHLLPWSNLSTLLRAGVKEVCARIRVMSGVSVSRTSRFSEETSLAIVEGALNVDVFKSYYNNAGKRLPVSALCFDSAPSSPYNLFLYN